jgi:hypothetical protein
MWLEILETCIKPHLLVPCDTVCSFGFWGYIAGKLAPELTLGRLSWHLPTADVK